MILRKYWSLILDVPLLLLSQFHWVIHKFLATHDFLISYPANCQKKQVPFFMSTLVGHEESSLRVNCSLFLQNQYNWDVAQLISGIMVLGHKIDTIGPYGWRWEFNPIHMKVVQIATSLHVGVQVGLAEAIFIVTTTIKY